MIAAQVPARPELGGDPRVWAGVGAVALLAVAVAGVVAWRRTRGLEAARRGAEERAERAQERLARLSEASRVLASSLDLEQTVTNLARLTVPALADVCVIDLVEDGALRRTASFAPPYGESLAAVLEHDPPSPGDTHHPVVRAMRTGRTLHAEEVTATLAATMATSEAQHRLLRALRPLSGMVVPLAGRRGVLGALTLATLGSSGRRLCPDDLPLVEELARRAAAAVENARLYAHQRSAAETLQRSLLPEHLPEVPGLAAAARYFPAGPGAEVGGDWYEVMVLPGGAVAVALGDVMGRGIRAASLMAQLKHAVRAYALEGRDPPEILERLNALLFHGEGPPLATLVYAVVDLATGTVRVSNAGHVPPLVVSGDGDATFVDVGRGLPLGARAHVHYIETVTTVAPGSTVLLYTDGLVEDRDTPIDTGLERLRSAVANGPGDLEALCDHVVEVLLSGRAADDDVALLAVRPLPIGSHLHVRVPSEPRMLAPLRATLRRWLGAAGATQEEAHDLLIACGEACANAIEHASGPGRAHFELEAELEAGEVRVAVRDRGTWRAPRPGIRGRGLRIMEALVDRLVIERDSEGTEVRLWRRLSGDRVAP